MADAVIKTTVIDTSFEPEDSDKTPVQLQYPTIELKTSFESLLSHSTSSSSTISMPRPAGLDESWASLDTSDFSHDEDTRSDIADTGSLVDFFSNNDSESVAEDDVQSENHFGNDRATSMIGGGPSHEDHHTRVQKQAVAEDEAIEDTIIMQASHIQDDSGHINLEHNRSLPSSTVLGQAAINVVTQEMIRMTVSKHPLKLNGRPFNVAYYGTASAYETKDELLGKVGAALVAGSAVPDPRSTPTSPVFNIVPTEFGPGSKPAFADLIPSQAQMTVEDVALLKPAAKDPTSIKIGFKRGVVLESKSAPSSERHSCDAWRPDLLVIQVSRDDAAEDYYTVKELFELARRHRWPTITVTKDAPNGLCPTHSYQGIIVMQDIETDEGAECNVQPIDLDSFIAIDTDQLNRHIRHIIDQSYQLRARDLSLTATTFKQRVAKFAPRLFMVELPAQPLKPYTLKLVEQPSCQRTPRQPRRELSFLESLGLLISTINARQAIKDIFLSITVLLLATYIVGFSQGLIKKANDVGCVQSLSEFQKWSNAHTVTATATAITSQAVSTTSFVPSIEQDAVVDHPLSFDHMWNRLTGRPVVEQQPQPAHQETREENLQNPEDEPVKVSNYKAMMDAVENAIQEFKASMAPASTEQPHRHSLIDKARHMLQWNRYFGSMRPPRATSFVQSLSDHFSRQKPTRAEKQAQIQEMHQKFSVWWTDVSTNFQGLGKQSQEVFNDLVKQSQRHLRQARWVTEKHLDLLVKEQKRLLTRAQHQANVLAHEMPQRKKQNILTRRRI